MSLQEIFRAVQGWLADLWSYPIPWESFFIWAAIIVFVMGAVIGLAVAFIFFGGRAGKAVVKKTDFDVGFEATYDDGRSEWFHVDKLTLRSGDQIAKLIAEEWQRGGRLPTGKITSVKRLPT